MTCPCQDCPERRLVCHDHCPAYLEYHEERLAIRNARQHLFEVESTIIEGFFRRERAVKVKRRRR